MKKNKNKRKTTVRARLGYAFDNIMSRGTVSMVGILFSITALVVIISGIAVSIFDKSHISVGSSIWISLMHAIDSGTLTTDNGSLLFMFLMTLVTICGLFITSVLIGIVNTGMERKMEALQKGKSCVLENDHVVILGTNRNVFTIIEELIEANSTKDKAVIVIMDNKMEKEEMENAIRQRISDTKTTKIICRSGSITDLADLKICSPEYAKSIIINSDDDFVTIKAILAVNSLLKKAKNHHAYITAVIQDIENYEAAVIAGEKKAEILFLEDTLARIVAHASRQPGLSSVYTELFTFEGNEIYIRDFPDVAGRTMKNINLYFPRSTVIGIDRNDEILLLPPNETKIMKNDRLILIAENDSVSAPMASPAKINITDIKDSAENSPDKDIKMLIFGYSPRLSKILAEEDCHLAKNSEILLAVQEEYRNKIAEITETEYKNIKVNLYIGDIYHKSTVGKLLEWEPDAILVNSSQIIDAQEDDSKTLLLLLQLKALSKENHGVYSVTSEMREIENQELAQITEVKYFIISSNITSHMVTQISHSRELNRIFTELLTHEGSEIYMRPASDYIKPGKEIDMYTAGAAAANKNQIFIGYRTVNKETGNYNVITNPPKDSRLSFKDDDKFIVLAKK